jgi:hypothetical protein
VSEADGAGLFDAASVRRVQRKGLDRQADGMNSFLLGGIGGLTGNPRKIRTTPGGNGRPKPVLTGYGPPLPACHHRRADRTRSRIRALPSRRLIAREGSNRSTSRTPARASIDAMGFVPGREIHAKPATSMRTTSRTAGKTPPLVIAFDRRQIASWSVSRCAHEAPRDGTGPGSVSKEQGQGTIARAPGRLSALRNAPHRKFR